jgi:hypothetical protein
LKKENASSISGLFGVTWPVVTTDDASKRHFRSKGPTREDIVNTLPRGRPSGSLDLGTLLVAISDQTSPVGLPLKNMRARKCLWDALYVVGVLLSFSSPFTGYLPLSRHMKWYGKYGRKVSWIVKWYGITIPLGFHPTYFSFCIIQIFLLFNLLFFHIFHIIS